MDEIVTEQAAGVLRVQLNRPTKRNAMTSAMYVALADISTRRRKTRARVSSSGMARAIRSVPATISRTF